MRAGNPRNRGMRTVLKEFGKKNKKKVEFKVLRGLLIERPAESIAKAAGDRRKQNGAITGGLIRLNTCDECIGKETHLLNHPFSSILLSCFPRAFIHNFKHDTLSFFCP